MATEVASLPLREDLGDDFDLNTSEAYRDTLTTLKKQRGFQRVYWGLDKEDAKMLRFFVDWDSVEDHIAFTKTEGYSAFMDRLGEVIDLDQGQLYHINAIPHPPLVLGDAVAPITEIWTVSFPLDYPENLQMRFEALMRKLFGVVEQQHICKGSSGGWVLEDINVPGILDQVKSFQAFIGWRSLRECREFHETSTFRDAVAPVEAAAGLLKITLRYYSGTVEDGHA